MGSRRAIYNDLATSTSVFCRPRQQKFPREFFFPRKAKNLGFGAISLYIALRNPIYTLHLLYIYIYIYYVEGKFAGQRL